MSGGVGLAKPVSAMPVDQGNSQRQLPPGYLPEQVDDGERAAGAGADDRDDRALASVGMIREVHSRIIVYYFGMINRI